MPQGPAGGPRPFAKPNAEVNIYLVTDHVTDRTMEKLYKANLPHIKGGVDGPVGELNNVVTTTLRSNSTSLRDLEELENRVENATGMSVSDIEVIM